MASERQARYERRQAEKAADIKVIPAVVNPARREACRLDLEKFLVEYFPFSTGLSAFSTDHKKLIGRMQEALLIGGRYAEAVFRGFAKTTMAENAALWALLYGHRKFIVIFGADSSAASGNIDSIKRELSENDLLMEDFPEVCHAVRALEGKPQRCASQTHTPGNVEGYAPAEDAEPERTCIEWTADKIVLPRIMLPDGWSAASEGVVTVRGLTAGCRGLKHKRADGTQQRPDFVFIDDPQTDESARSPLQIEKRIDTIKRAILQLGGHRKKIAVLMCGTIIARDDLMHQFVDSKRNPSWQSDRVPMVRKWSDAHAKWMGEYQDLRTLYDKDLPGDQQRAHRAATEFYRVNREAMDAGCEVSWASCYDPERELSAIQHAYNALIDDGEDVFASEYQNDPKETAEEAAQLKAGQVAAKAVNIPRGILPQWTTHITAFVDVQDSILYGCVCAWGTGFRGNVVHYSTFPEQARAYFSHRDVQKTIQVVFPGISKEASIRAALEAYVQQLAGRQWKREDGADLSLNLCLVDAGDGDHFDIVKDFCRRSPLAGLLKPSKGQYVGAASAPWETETKKEGVQYGLHWRITPLKQSASRLTLFDTNFWKTFVANRIAAPIGDGSGIELHEGDHRMYADHITGEYGVRTEGRGRMLTEWKLRVGRDNHWLDATVGCAVGASIVGVQMRSVQSNEPRKKIRLSEIQRARAM